MSELGVVAVSFPGHGLRGDWNVYRVPFHHSEAAATSQPDNPPSIKDSGVLRYDPVGCTGVAQRAGGNVAVKGPTDIVMKLLHYNLKNDENG